MKLITALLISFSLVSLQADIELDGDDVINGTTIGDTSGFTFMVWCKVGTQTSAPAVLLYNGDDNANGYGLMIHDGSGGVGQIITVVAGGVNFNVTTSATTLTAGTWNHIAFKAAASGSTATLYVNGAVASTGTITFNNPSGSFFKVGGNVSGNGFIGTIAEVLYHNGALSDTAILAEYTDKLKGGWIDRHGTTLNWWLFDEGSEGTAGNGVTVIDRNPASGGAGNLVVDDGANNAGATFRGSTHLTYK